jgi:hypothetical protein
MSTVEIACCGVFHRVNGVPWTCRTCGQTHLGAAPPTFLWRVQEHLAAVDAQIRTLQEEIVTRKQAMRRLEVEHEALHGYLTLMEEQDHALE